jgi:hypothetical protein
MIIAFTYVQGAIVKMVSLTKICPKKCYNIVIFQKFTPTLHTGNIHWWMYDPPLKKVAVSLHLGLVPTSELLQALTTVSLKRLAITTMFSAIKEARGLAGRSVNVPLA